MVCSKCAKLATGTKLATPGVKKKNEIYLGSPAASSSKSATLGQTGIGKVRFTVAGRTARRELIAKPLHNRANFCPKMPKIHMRSTRGELVCRMYRRIALTWSQLMREVQDKDHPRA